MINSNHILDNSHNYDYNVCWNYYLFKEDKNGKKNINFIAYSCVDSNLFAVKPIRSMCSQFQHLLLTIGQWCK